MSHEADATAVYVAYRTPALDVEWIPDDAPIVVVHNDRALDQAAVRHSNVTHVLSESNVGFGAAVNLALPHVDTSRVVLCNPDTQLTREHWDALVAATDDQLVTVQLIERDGTPTSILNHYPTPASLVLTSYRVGRGVRRGSRMWRLGARLLGTWGERHVALMDRRSGEFGLHEHWVSGAVLSISMARLRAIGGFDPAYFLYLEDVDLCRRLAAAHRDMHVVLAPVPPAVHLTGGSAPTSEARREVNRHYVASARRYSSNQTGPAWRLAGLALLPRARWLNR